LFDPGGCVVEVGDVVDEEVVDELDFAPAW
jgi:hypothetical protein